MLKFGLFFIALFVSPVIFADAASDSGIGTIASNVTGEFQAIGQLILAVAFLAGIGFIMAAIFKFKQHKDNPQQITLGVPLSMLVIGAVLVFLPSLIGPAGYSIFKGGTPGGFTGSGYTAVPGAGK